MIIPEKPQNEELRLAALATYDVVDTLPEQDYDDITALAAMIAGTPIALVSLVDRTRQVFKSHHGLDVAHTPREIAFCAHAINRPTDLFVIEDSRQDERFKDNPLVTGDPHVTFYAGAPLVNPEGYALGTLCVIDHEPRTLTQAQEVALRALSRQVINLMEGRRRNAELNRIKSKLEETNLELSEFAHRASHDLREPLRSIKSFMALLEKHLGNTMDEKTAKYIRLANAGAKRLHGLITDLIAYAQVTRGDHPIEEVNMTQVVADVLHLLPGAVSETGEPYVHYENLPTVRAHAVPMQQLFQNLIGNAIKYTRPGEVPRVNITCTESVQEWEFAVQDNGIGIDPEFRETIFLPFKRLHTDEVYDGSGLGLATCKKIVEKFGGRIWVTSQPEKSSIFHFTINKHLT